MSEDKGEITIGDIQGRKADHINICLEKDTKASYNYWDDVQFIHDALPEVDFDSIDISTHFLGADLEAPIIISAITGGYGRAKEINRNLATAAEKVGVGLGVGSQRPAIEDQVLADSYAPVLEFDIPLKIGNLGAPQLIPQNDKEPFTIEDGHRALEMIDGDVLAIHLNFLQEAAQPEGDLRASGCFDVLKQFSRELPVIAKETGAGISRHVARSLTKTSIQGIDVGGMSGTSFSAVEVYRAREAKDLPSERVGTTFWNWGIPTPASVLEASVGLPLIATGGIRTGLDVARAIALGADVGGIAGTLVRAATMSAKHVEEELNIIIRELKTALFLTGCQTIKELPQARRLITGPLNEWVNANESGSENTDQQQWSRAHGHGWTGQRPQRKSFEWS